MLRSKFISESNWTKLRFVIFANQKPNDLAEMTKKKSMKEKA